MRSRAWTRSADFSIAHSANLVGCAALRGAQVGFDLEQGTDRRLENWVAREAVVKAAGLGVRAMGEVALSAGWRAVPRCALVRAQARELSRAPPPAS